MNFARTSHELTGFVFRLNVGIIDLTLYLDVQEHVLHFLLNGDDVR